MSSNVDAILVVAYGGPERMEDVMPFLENALRGRRVPRERMLAVAHHYELFGGVSPINAQCRALLAALQRELKEYGPDLPVYWGNRNWHPLLPDTLGRMKRDGVRHALALFTSPYSSYSSCRQYREDITKAQQEVGPGAPHIEKLRAYFNHPGFIEPMVQRVREAIEQIPADSRLGVPLIFTAHSVPTAMAEQSSYVRQISESARLVAEAFPDHPWSLVWQSRSGPPQQPWLEPDICDHLRRVHVHDDPSHVVVVPIGFISDHMEVVYDLDTEAQAVAKELGMTLVRAKTVGDHPRFVRMIRELIAERVGGAPKQWLGAMGPSHDVCPVDCCPAPG